MKKENNNITWKRRIIGVEMEETKLQKQSCNHVFFNSYSVVETRRYSWPGKWDGGRCTCHFLTWYGVFQDIGGILTCLIGKIKRLYLSFREYESWPGSSLCSGGVLLPRVESQSVKCYRTGAFVLSPSQRERLLMIRFLDLKGGF